MYAIFRFFYHCFAISEPFLTENCSCHFNLCSIKGHHTPLTKTVILNMKAASFPCSAGKLLNFYFFYEDTFYMAKTSFESFRI